MNWRLKGAIQKVLGSVPGGHRIHFQLQRRIGGLTDAGREADIKVEDWRLMIGHVLASKIVLEEATLFEIGTGWYPTFPLCFYLAGARRVITVDLTRLLERELVLMVVERLARHVPAIARAAALPQKEVEARRLDLVVALQRGASIEEATHGVVDYRAPADATATKLPDDCVDVVFSNSVLEHLPPDVLEACFTEARRILRPGGISVHSVNCGDHYAYADPRIHQLNYLQYSEAQWRRWNNAFLYQNRLRAVDFLEVAKRSGFTIEIDTSRAHPKRLDELDGIAIDPAFKRYTREQLAVTSLDFVGRKPGPTRSAVASAWITPQAAQGQLLGNMLEVSPVSGPTGRNLVIELPEPDRSIAPTKPEPVRSTVDAQEDLGHGRLGDRADRE